MHAILSYNVARISTAIDFVLACASSDPVEHRLGPMGETTSPGKRSVTTPANVIRHWLRWRAICLGLRQLQKAGGGSRRAATGMKVNMRYSSIGRVWFGSVLD